MRAKKHLGQHFLTSKAIAEKIAETAKIGPKDNVLEIGPGKGILTEALLARAGAVIAVEKDLELVDFLKDRFSEQIKTQRLILVHDDALHFDPSNYSLPTTHYKLVSNIPYYITGAILEHFLSLALQPSSITLLVQKEVAERIVGHPSTRSGSQKESILSLSVKAYGTPRYVRTVKAGSFSPPPKVDSAILAIENISRKFFTQNSIDEKQFFALIKRGFAHKRKKLSSNLNISREELLRAGIAENARAEELHLAEWISIANALQRNSR